MALPLELENGLSRTAERGSLMVPHCWSKIIVVREFRS